MDVVKAVQALGQLTNVKLPDDAAEAGFGTMNKALSQINDGTQRATRIACEAIAEAARLNKDRARAALIMSLREAQLMSEDEEVKAGKSSEARQAMAKRRMEAEVKVYEKADALYQEMRAVVQAAETVLAALKSAKELAGHQLGISQKEIELGMMAKREG